MSEVNYIIRKEYFGGIIYNKRNFDYYLIDDYGFEIINNLKNNGFKKTSEYYKKHSQNYGYVAEYFSVLETHGILQGEELNNAKIIKNNINHKTLSAPIKAYLTITENCNLKCKHCFGDFGQGMELTIEQIENILNQLEELGVWEISITGGEPLCHPNILEIIEIIASKGFNILLTTNGTLINDKIINFISKNYNKFFRFSISIDGIPNTHDQIRGKNTFNKIKLNIEKLNANKINFAVNSVLTSDNINTLENFLNELCEMNVKNCSFNPIRQIGRASNYGHLFIDKGRFTKEYEKVIDTLIKYSQRFNMTFYFYRGFTISNGKINLPKFENELLYYLDVQRCGAGNIIATITANGSLIPCVFLSDLLKSNNLKSESILNKPFKEIWDNNEQFKFIRNLKVNSKCQKCAFHRETCSGMCPADEYITNGSYCLLNSFVSQFNKKAKQV